MTNFSAQSSPSSIRWLTPERAVLVLPVMAGMGAAVLMFLGVLTPLWVRFNNQRELLEVVSMKSAALPQKQKELSQLSTAISERKQQQDRLLSLVAGQDDLSTFLAELNDLAQKHSVVITTTEPGAVERFVPPSPSITGTEAATPAVAGAAATGVVRDALLSEGLEKRSAGLTVKGLFPQVSAFLQDLERLQVFVTMSDLSLQVVTETFRAGDEVLEVPFVELALTFTAYGRQMDQVEVKSSLGDTMGDG